MENTQPQGGEIPNETAGEVENSAPAEDVSGDQTGEAPADDQNGADGQPQEVGEEGEANDFVKDDEGNEYIPRKAFEARIAKLTAQKHDAVGQLLEAVNSSPEAKQKILEALGVSGSADSEQADDTGAPENSPFLQYLEKSVSKEYHDHYKGMADALYAEITPRMQKMYMDALKPVLSYIGKQQVDNFEKSVPDYGKYAPKIQEMVASGRAKTLQDAYILASHDDKIKGVGASAVKSEKARVQKLASSPIRKSPGVSANGPRKYASMREAMEDAYRKLQ